MPNFINAAVIEALQPYYTMRLIIPLVVGLTILLSLFLAWALMRTRQRMIAALRQTNLDLEDQVQTRTIAHKRAEEKFRGLLEATPDAMVIVNAAGQIVMVNSQTKRLFGYNRDEMVGQPVEILIPDRFAQHAQYRQTYRQAPHPRPMGIDQVLFARRKDRSEFPVEISLSPFEAPEEELLVLAAIRDVTKRQRTQDFIRAQRDMSLALNKTRDLNETLRLCLQHAIQISGLDSGGIYLMNETGDALWLVVQQNLPADFVVGNSSYGANAPQVRSVQQGEPFYGHYDRPAKVRVTAMVPVLHREQTIAGLLVTSHRRPEIANYTRFVLETISGQIGSAIARAQSEEALQRLNRELDRRVNERTMALKTANEAHQISEKKYRNLVETMNEGLIMLDSQGIISYVNQSYCHMFGYSSSALIGHSLSHFLPQSDRDILPRLLSPTQAGNDRFYEQIIPHKTGQAVFTVISPQPIFDQAGEFQGSFAVVTDITTRKETEEALKQAKESAEAANRAKSIFLANMSHEIRTPLNAILGFSQLMQRDTTLGPKQRDYLNTIGRSGEHLLGLLNSILELSKIEAGRMMLQPVNFDLHTFLADLEIMFRLQTETKQLQFEVNWDDRLPRYVVADAGKLRQVLINLLGNAIRFTEKGGIILNATAKPISHDNLRLMIAVKDTGVGIKADEIERVFNYFEQTSSGIQTGGGSGLGLAISKQYINLMGGEISVASQVGRGSIFQFDIQIKAGNLGPGEPSAARQRVIRLQPGQPEYRVLVVDDKENNRVLLDDLLTQVGFTVRQAGNGVKAIEGFQAWRPHLILMDIIMPVMDGYEAIQRIRALPHGHETVILVATASILEENQDKVLAKGGDGYIRKPFREAELFTLIRQHLEVQFIVEKIASPDSEAKSVETGPLNRNAMAVLPAALVAQMREATLNLYIGKLNELIDQAADYDRPLAKGLQTLAEQYEYDQLFELFAEESR